MILTSRKESLEIRKGISRQVLFFHTTDSQTFYKVALEEWIQNRDWKGCDHNHGHTTCFFWKSNSQLTRKADCFGDVIHILLDLHEQILQWIQVVTLDVKKGVEPVIPETKSCQERDGRDTW